MIKASPNNITQLTNNDRDDYELLISGSNIFWVRDDGNDYEIFLDDGTSTTQLTDNDYDDFNLRSLGDKVIWEGGTFSDSGIYLYDGTSTTQLTESFGSLDIWDNKLVWDSYDDNDSEIYLYDGTSTTQLTDNDYSERFPQIWGNNVIWTSYEEVREEPDIYFYDGTDTIKLTDNYFYSYRTLPDIWGNNVVWIGAEINLYDGTSTIQIADNDYSYSSPQIWGNKVVWRGIDSDSGDTEAYLYDGIRTIRLTENDYFEEVVTIQDNNVVWTALGEVYLYDGSNTIHLSDNNGGWLSAVSGNRVVWWSGINPGNRDYYLYDGSNTIQLTDNNGRNDFLQITDNKVFWRGYDGNDWELYVYEIESGQQDNPEEDDWLIGSSDSDTIFGFDGDDFLEGGVGADSLDGGEGSDTASYANAAAGVTINLATGVATGEEANGDRFNSIENILGSTFDDRLVGDAQNNILTGGEGSDTLRGGDGDDLLIGGDGADSFSGDDGIDTVSYVDSKAAVSVSLATGEASGGEAEGDVFLDTIENIEGSTFDDLLVGDRNNNILKGNVGNDTLQGGAGNDSLYGGDGTYVLLENTQDQSQKDIYQIIGSADILRGGAGDDFYQLNISPIQVRLNPESEDKTNLSIASGSQIEDSQGEDTISLQTMRDNTKVVDADLRLSAPSTEYIGIAKNNTSLVIDINQDGMANPQDDLSILNFFDESGTGAGEGYMENVANLSGAEILDFINNPASSAPRQLDFTIDTDSLNNKLLKIPLGWGWIYEPMDAAFLLKVDLWLQTPDGSWTDIPDVEGFNQWRQDSRWGFFGYELGLDQYAPGKYYLWGQGYNAAQIPSNSVIKSFTIPQSATNSSPSDLSFEIERSSKTYIPTETLTIKEGWVYDQEGTDNLARVDMWVLRRSDNQWIDLDDVISFSGWNEDNRWAAFDYQISLSEYQPSDYTLWGQTYDRNGLTSNSYMTNFTVAPNSAPEQLQFQTDRLNYRPGETVRLREAWIYDADSVYDLASIDFWLLKPDGSWDNLDDVTQFEAWNEDNNWASFDYQFSLGSYEPGTYRVWGQAYDNSSETSNGAIATLTIADSSTIL